MRIVGGTFGGRRFSPPARIPARPTTEVAKEGLFNMLGNMLDFDGLKTCDLFGGTGSISYELASRGASSITVIERDPESIEFIKKTATALAIDDILQIIRGDVFKFMKQSMEQYNFIFADPPYALTNIDELPLLETPQLYPYEKLRDNYFYFFHPAKQLICSAYVYSPARSTLLPRDM
jgi:16S rRNA (guanine966-N2)-methyltransferase